MYCAKCGRKLTEEDLFCPGCGSKNKVIWRRKETEAAKEVPLKETTPAPVVSKTIQTEECGETDKTEKTEETDSSANTQSKKKSYKLYIAAILVVAGIIGTTYFHDQQIKAGNDSSSVTAAVVNKMRDPEIYGYAGGTYEVGVDIPAGEYAVFVISDKQGKFNVSRDRTGDETIFKDSFRYNSIFTVRDGEYLQLNNCRAKKIETVDSINTSGNGMFKIGTYLPAGEYELVADSDSGYYCIYNNSRFQDIIKNDNFEGNVYVSVKDGQYLKLSRCHIVNQQ